MRKQALLAGVFLLLPLSLMAQSTPKADLSLGYSYLRLEETDLHGWNISLAGTINKNLAMVADFSGHYSSDQQTIGSNTFTSDLNAHTFLGGPRVSETVGGKWTPYVHALFGVSRLNASTDARTASGTASSVESSDTGFAMALGGGFDIKASENVSIRLIQGDYFLVRPEGVKSEGARISAGIVLHIGRK